MRALLVVVLALLLPGASLSAEPMCTAQSGAVAPWVVEIYTSEGCSSCPPADRWLSRVKDRRELMSLASVGKGELRFTPQAPTTPSALLRHGVLVITDAHTSLPIQALAAGC